MQVFRTALKAFFRHPIYILIYVVGLSCMGVFMGMSVNEAPSEEYLERPTIAVIDRDGGKLSKALRAFVCDQAEVAEVEDTERALQDAVMQQVAHYILIIPENFSADFAKSATDGTQMPSMQTVVSTQSVAATMMDNLVNEYLNVARMYTVALSDASPDEVVSRTNEAMRHSAPVSVVQTTDAAPVSASLQLYLQFASYTILLSISVCTAVIISRFGQQEIHRRIGSSPLPELSCNLQIAAACLVITLLCWAFVGALGIVAFGGPMFAGSTSVLAGALAALLCYALFGLAFGFFVGQLTKSEAVMNAASNITGLVVSFLGGVWISLDLVGEPIVTIAKFTPVYYYNEALQAIFGTSGNGDPSAALANLGIVCLFALVVFSIGLAISKLRTRGGSAWNVSSTKASSQSAA